MGFLSIGFYMNQFNPKKKKKNTINHKKKKVHIKSTISLGVRHPKKYKLNFFFSINIKLFSMCSACGSLSIVCSNLPFSFTFFLACFEMRFSTPFEYSVQAFSSYIIKIDNTKTKMRIIGGK